MRTGLVLIAAAISCSRAPPSSPGTGGASSPSGVRAFGRSTFAFGVDLHRALAGDREWALRNVVISPYSLRAAFAMIHAGATGETAREITATLRDDFDAPERYATWTKLRAALAELEVPAPGGGPVEFLVANSLWVQTGFDLAPAYRASIADHYGGVVESLDIVRAPEAARVRINGWVKQRTRGLLNELFPPGSLPSATPLVVVNAAYMRGAWEEPFPRAETRSEPFEMLDGRRVKVPMMHRTATAGYVETTDYQATEVRYAGDRLSMIVIVPALGRFVQVEQALEASMVAGLLEELPRTQRRVRLALPKLAVTMSFSLAPKLGQLGMKRAFRADAELQGMVAQSSAPFFLGQVRHQVRIAMDEEQTEAAAATGVTVTYGATTEDATVRIDRPFLIGIHDRKTGMLLFWGRIVDAHSDG